MLIMRRTPETKTPGGGGGLPPTALPRSGVIPIYRSNESSLVTVKPPAAPWVCQALVPVFFFVDRAFPVSL